ncbi:hypothetical protein, partial [Pseudomonas protegens]|uniref:hypothetical protein n=1 Tax=Pseudomonas protegens TaxID=380021 RepID=UPI001B33730E
LYNIRIYDFIQNIAASTGSRTPPQNNRQCLRAHLFPGLLLQPQQKQDVANLSRDVEHANNALSPIFDKEK